MRDNDPRTPWRILTRNHIQRLFPERQVVLRAEGRVAYVRLTTRLQFAFAVLALLALGWTAFSSVTFLLHTDIVAEKDQKIAQGKFAYRVLLDEFQQWKRINKSLTDNLEDQTSVMRALTTENKSLQTRLEQATVQLKRTEAERDQIIAARESLKNEIKAARGRMLAVASGNDALRNTLDSMESRLQETAAERDQVMFEANRMRLHVGELESRLAELQTRHLDSVQKLNEQASVLVDDMERVVTLTGLTVADLSGENRSLFRNQGGPFIPTQPDGLAGDALKSGLADLDVRLEQWERLKGVVRSLPLASPLSFAHVSSGFGKRRDPLNGKWAMHYGIDLGSQVKRAPVHATAPGVISFAGWRGNYGKLVEIDHGNGVRTRYGHLHKINVRKGQTIHFNDKIGLIGNTGRSTGEHVHYEVVVNGKPRNPMNFIKAGRHVFQE